MRILWSRVAAAVFAIAAVVLLVSSWHETTFFLEGMRRIGPGHAPEEQMMGAIAFAFVLLLIVAVLKLLTQGRDK